MIRLKCGHILLPFILAVAALRVDSQTASPSPPQAIDETRLVTLHGTVHPLAQPGSDRGAVPDTFAASRMLLILNRSADREAALQRFLREVHIPGSPRYHQWVTPDEFGARFGPSDADVQTIVGWLRSHGFAVPRVTKSRNFIEFSGTAAQVREALHSQIHGYSVNGETRYSIAEEAAIPEALAPLVRGFAPLNNFPLTKYSHAVGPATYSPSTRRVTPLFTTTVDTKTFYALAPEDFATQYNLSTVYKAGVDGSGQTIGILGETNLDLSLVDAYRALFHLPGDHTQVIMDGEATGSQFGILPDAIEGYLDVEVSGSVAPKATIDFYTAGGTYFQSLLALAALRAVEDNQASILSASFGECEQLLGVSGNQFWSALWEQAAAQGQTVFVSSGDTGPTTCPLALVNGEVAQFGLNVNGLSSTPWNVSVGGTDFYYSDYASGAPSAATLWNQTNDSSLGSLTTPLREQPWDNVFGFNVVPFSSSGFSSIPSLAGGGGPSNCSQLNSATSPPSCAAGYPKPSWQNAPGVPSDGVRDLPDVSLFAANGKNLSAYPICANAGDCAPVTSGEPQVFLVGGTSASSPAMAGIMALVNQKTGSRQGQADFVFYALARQMPNVFHDIAIGTNDVLCILPSPNCSGPVLGSGNLGSYGVYAAGPGYDHASGLGSVDGNALVNNWTEITFLPTTTTLQLSPSTIVHGSPVTVGVSVQSSSSSGSGAVPSGDVDIATTALVPLPQSGALALTNGSANASVNFFPGGTYQVTAQYAGDGVFATSSSSPATLTVTPEPSSTNLAIQYRYIDYSASPVTNHFGTVQNGDQIPFGSEWTFEGRPSGLNSQSQGDATGTATFTDGQASVQVPLNSSGTAVWSPQFLAVGSHSVSASYSGDASYNSSNAGPLNFTVVKGTPRLIAYPDATAVLIGGSTTPSYAAGSSFVVHVLLGTLNSIIPPGGNVTVNFGAQSQTLPLTADAFINQGLSTAFFTFPNVAVGTYTLSASYSGDSNWNSTNYTDPSSLTFATMTAIPTTTTLTVTPSSITSSTAATFTVTVQASQSSTSAPVGDVSLYANGSIFAHVFLAGNGIVAGTSSPPSAASSPSASTGTVVVPGSAIPAGTLQVSANYGGLFSFAPSISTPVTLTVTPTDFSMSLAASRVVIKSGQSATIPILLVGPNGASVALSLACTPSSSQIGCQANPSSPSVSGNMTSTLTINAFAPAATANLSPGIGLNLHFRLAGAILLSSFSVLGALFFFRKHRRRTAAWAGLAVLVLAVGNFAVGCGSMGSSGPSSPTNVNAPPGSYTLLVTGTSSGVVHNAKISVIVQ